MKKCVMCKTDLMGSQRLFCSNACKQADKYARKRGKRCAECHKPIPNPVPVLGGFSQCCFRKACIEKRGV